MTKTSLLTERDIFPIPLYLGEERIRIVRYLYLKDLEKELTPKRYKNIKLAIEEKRLYYAYVNQEGGRIEYKTIKI